MPKRTEQPEVQQDIMAEYLHEHHPSWSVDTLLAHPTDALAFGLHVAARLQKISDREARAICKLIGTLNEDHSQAITEIQRACLTAINLRKRGEFTHGLRKGGK
jgi:hypothetical protein